MVLFDSIWQDFVAELRPLIDNYLKLPIYLDSSMVTRDGMDGQTMDCNCVYTTTYDDVISQVS